ncbi:MAG TPA: N-6 DNA methylase [Gemmatimonadales bacterium]
MPPTTGGSTLLVDAARLIHQLGGEAYALGRPAAERAELIEIGTLAALPAWLCTGDSRAVATVARRLARSGQLGVVVARDHSQPYWRIAVTVTPVQVVVLPVAEGAGVIARRVQRAACGGGPGIERALALAEALDMDAAGRRTFRALRRLLDSGVALLPASVPVDDRHGWILAQITRLLFLRFVESEGWLDGNPRFLTEAFDRCLGTRRDPTRHLLHPLFFGTLNRRWSDRSRCARAFGAVPFLNGGLFEPHALERRYRLHLPTSYWCDLFAALVERVDVSLDAEVDDGRVTPEVLGRVFEGVMAPAERKDQGAFFTPPALVDAVVVTALSCHLAHRLGRQEASVRRALDDPDPQLQSALLDVTVLDPAAGSGAFLVGALQRLHGPGPRDAVRIRRIINRSLYGVDRNPGAVRLTELRLWLEVLRGMRGSAPSAVPPLPNLDATVRAGDALIDPLHGLTVDAAIAANLRARQRAIGGRHGADKRAAINAARQGERTAQIDALRRQEAVLDRQVAELLAAGRAPTLFGDRAPLDAGARTALSALRRERADVRRECARVLRDGSAPPFAIRAAFAPLFAARGGFDLVLGNPPWVRAERLPAPTRMALQARYRWWRSGSARGWGHLPDLAVAFVERSVTLLAPGGTYALLVPAKLTTAGYGLACRAGLVSQTTLHCVADLSADPRATFDATTYPLALIGSRRVAAIDQQVAFTLDQSGGTTLQGDWVDQSHWLTGAATLQRLMRRLQHAHPPLSDTVRIQLGVKTGANGVFVDPPPELDRWCRPAIRGRDIGAFASKAGARLLWPADRRGVPWQVLPARVARHLAPHHPRLMRRADLHHGPIWQLFRVEAATARYRVVWADLARSLAAACLDDADSVPLNSCYVAAMPTAVAARALTGWLNSAPVQAMARLGAEAASGGFARFGARAVGLVPLPADTLADPELVHYAGSEVRAPDRDALDDYACRRLDLTASERKELGDVAANRR